jgi:hypothetical protein
MRYVPGPQSDYVRDRCAFIKALQLLGIVTDVRMGRVLAIDGKKRWALILECDIQERDDG